MIFDLIYPDISTPAKPVSLHRATSDACRRICPTVVIDPDAPSPALDELHDRITQAAARGDLCIHVCSADLRYYQIVPEYWSLESCADARRWSLVSGRFKVPIAAVDPTALCHNFSNRPLFVERDRFRRLTAGLRTVAYAELARLICHSLSTRNERIIRAEFEIVIEHMVGSLGVAALKGMWERLPRACKLSGRPARDRLPPALCSFTHLAELHRDQKVPRQASG